MKYDINDCCDKINCRYALGKSGKNMILCIGLNPSTATDKKTDNTFSRIEKIAENNGYDGFVVLNLYPVRGTKPKNVKFDEKFLPENIAMLKKHLDKYPDAQIWCAWGNNVTRRGFKTCFKEIKGLIEGRDCVCTSITNKEHPVHPLFAANNTKLVKFCIKNYNL